MLSIKLYFRPEKNLGVLEKGGEGGLGGKVEVERQ